MKAALTSLFIVLYLFFSLSGCSSPKLFKFRSTSGDRSCEVTVLEKGAEGNCTAKNGARVLFELWSVTSRNYSILAQGLNSNSPSSTTDYGLLINGVEQRPSDSYWNRLLQNPNVLCDEACGSAGWVSQTTE